MAKIEKREVVRYTVELSPEEMAGLKMLVGMGVSGKVATDLDLQDLHETMYIMTGLPDIAYKFNTLAMGSKV